MSERLFSHLNAILMGFSLVIRLDFVHATAAMERWTEEVRILECEMPATCLSLRNMALTWTKRVECMDMLGVGEENARSMCDEQWINASPEMRGYAAYASRQVALYMSLETEALEQFEEVVGKNRWKEILLPYISQGV